MNAMLDRVTFTGIDDATDMDALRLLVADFPCIELGVLVRSHCRVGPRYPSYEFFRELCESRWLDDRSLSLHLCGEFVTEICETGKLGFAEVFPKIFHLFRRVQLNFGPRRRQSLNVEKVVQACKGFDQQFIFQCAGEDDHLVSHAHDDGLNVACLYDVSGGKGILPDSWPGQMFGIYTGYAGGLTPDNIGEQLPRIARQGCPGQSFWIDFESGIRTDNQFDVDKCRKVLDLVYPF